MNGPLRLALDAARTRLLNTLDAVPAADLQRQFHPALSPIGWHMGHSAVIEAYWLHEVVLNRPIASDWKAFYFPEFSPKAARGARLPSKEALKTFCRERYAEHDALLTQWSAHAPTHPLLERDYLLHFLIQHHAQHAEIVQQILTERALQQSGNFTVTTPLAPRTPQPLRQHFHGGVVEIGDAGAVECYDNELRQHTVTLAPFAMARHAVSNAEYLGFMNANGYDTRAYWSDAGWQWRGSHNQTAPNAWRRDARGHWYEVGADGAYALDAATPVNGVSYFEAEAYARYVALTHIDGARLPQEAEWEHALRQGAFAWGDIGAWEWCDNAFYPYPGFRAFPYDGYSTPWFDGSHRALRGASRATAECIKRPTFRNFYTPEKRHVFAGVRLAYTLAS